MGRACVIKRMTKTAGPRWMVRYRLGGRGARLVTWGTYRDPQTAQEVCDEVNLAISGGRLRPRSSRDLRQEFVYFARLGALLKIGVSVEPKERCRSLNAELLAFQSGGRDLERRLHERFSHLRETGEWFRFGPDLGEYVEELQRALADDERSRQRYRREAA